MVTEPSFRPLTGKLGLIEGGWAIAERVDNGEEFPSPYGEVGFDQHRFL